MKIEEEKILTDEEIEQRKMANENAKYESGIFGAEEDLENKTNDFNERQRAKTKALYQNVVNGAKNGIKNEEKFDANSKVNIIIQWVLLIGIIASVIYMIVVMR